jgi:hypothetical protein
MHMSGRYVSELLNSTSEELKRKLRLAEVTVDKQALDDVVRLQNKALILIRNSFKVCMLNSRKLKHTLRIAWMSSRRRRR